MMGKAVSRHCTRASRSLKSTTFAERLRCVGNPSGNEIGSRPVKYWEIIADNLKKAGWSLGWVSALDVKGRTTWVVDAHRDGKRFVHAGELLTAFMELRAATQAQAADSMKHATYALLARRAQ